jgi:hypothetical protein
VTARHTNPGTYRSKRCSRREEALSMRIGVTMERTLDDQSRKSPAARIGLSIR